MRPALLVAAWTACACLGAVAGLARPSELYLPPGKRIALLPDATLVGVIEATLQGVQSAESCAEQCRAALPACSFFGYCNGQAVRSLTFEAACLAGVGCADARAQPALPPPPPLPLPPPRLVCHALWHAQAGCSTQSYGKLEQGDCLILTRNCTLPADREAAPGMVSGAGGRWRGLAQARLCQCGASAWANPVALATSGQRHFLAFLATTAMQASLYTNIRPRSYQVLLQAAAAPILLHDTSGAYHRR